MVKKIVSLVLIMLIAISMVFVAIGSLQGDDLYIVDKGMALSYVDEYNFTHDSVYWLVAGDDEHVYTIFVPSRTWYNYAVGEIYHGGMSQYLIYEGDDGIARYLGDENYVHP